MDDDYNPLIPALEEMRKDAERYRALRRGQKWSVIDGIGDTLRGDALDAAIDAVMVPNTISTNTQK